MNGSERKCMNLVEALCSRCGQCQPKKPDRKEVRTMAYTPELSLEQSPAVTGVNLWKNMWKAKKRGPNEPRIFCLKRIMHSSPEVSFGKGMARTWFEVAFKLLGFFDVWAYLLPIDLRPAVFPCISASFFLRAHRLIWSSRLRAATILRCFSE
jgi:hypothetical protein